MSSETTPTKQSGSVGNVLSPGGTNTLPSPSPNCKRGLDFDYWNPSAMIKRKKEGNEPPEVEHSSNPGKPYSSKDKTLKIRELETGKYRQNELIIRVTLVSKYGIGSSGAVRTLKFHGMDESGEISFVAFEQTAHKFSDVIQLNECYKITGFDVDLEKKAFPSFTGHSFTITLLYTSTIEKVSNDLPSIPFDFASLENLQNIPLATKVDSLGIVVQNWGLKEYTGGKYRNLWLVDNTGQCRITLWKQNAIDFGDDTKVPVILRRAYVDSYEGCSCLNTSYYSLVWKNPTYDTSSLMEWFGKREKEREAEIERLTQED